MCGYGPQRVLNNVSFSITAGEMVGILGPNGSGKSTLMKAISGVLPLESGSIFIMGEEVSRISSRERAQRISAVPQKVNSDFPFLCRSVVLMGRYPYVKPLKNYTLRDVQIAENAMEVTKTTKFADRPFDQTSGGEAQLVTIARAIAQSTRILLLDEATSSLDVARKVQVFDMLRSMNSKGLTIVCVMHDLNLAALYCHRLLFIKQGKVVLDGPTEKIFTDENLSSVYETEIRVAEHPVTRLPQAHFVPGTSER